VLALLLILPWEENYGEEDHQQQKKTADANLYQKFKEGWTTTSRDSRIWRIGCVQALSEGAMYTFVFMWVPTLLSLDPPGGLPTGCVFSALMAAIALGGTLFPHLLSLSRLLSPRSPTETAASLTYAVAAVSMATAAAGLKFRRHSCFGPVLACFLTVETCVGLFLPAAGTLRSKYVPDALQGCILNIFRLPLNALVVAGTYATDHLQPEAVFALVSVWFFLAAVLQATLVGGNKGIKKD